MIKLLPEYKQPWLDALRSGKYKQGHGALRRGDAFCCLGVMADLLAKEENARYEWRIRDAGVHQPTFAIIERATGASSGGFPIDMMRKITNDTADLFYVMDKLVKMNDRDKCTFTEIADFIEQNM